MLKMCPYFGMFFTENYSVDIIELYIIEDNARNECNSIQMPLHRHSRAECVVGASAPYNHRVLLAGESGNPARQTISA